MPSSEADVSRMAFLRRRSGRPKARSGRAWSIQSWRRGVTTAVTTRWMQWRTGPYGEMAARLSAPVRRVVAPVTGLGWGVLAIALLAIHCWRVTGWTEFLAAGLAGLVCVVAAFVLSWWQGRMLVELSLQVSRVTVGESVAGQLSVERLGRDVLLPAAVEVPVGEGCGRFHLPAGRGVRTEDFTVLTQRRGVIAVGPARSVSGDPFGMVRREQQWSEMLEVCVHPRTVDLPSLDAGLIRDLEGRSTMDPSPADLDFHTVRPYVPADDRRHVHWKATAKSRSTGQSESLLVKQYYDTRRSHLGLIVDIDESHYGDADDVEMALEVAASLAVRARRDELDVTVVAGPQVIDAPVVGRLLDGFARIELGPSRMVDAVLASVALAPQLSLVVFVIGQESDQDDLRLALTVLPASVRAVVLRVHPQVPSGPTDFPGAVAMSLARTADLPRLVRGGGL
ncbi:DUF58 domain-containing protein [Austwickia sp. TVS 96-490-7B]|uniref:DUF58 domain-containing protein n=1 Tax=Austwickia sp. TVS 96-490-7B TaxID=2830843 RepID=UPI001C58B757|nr:DUF58 domain-containing protein [Austwickia sp. TVS 96-490-7B]